MKKVLVLVCLCVLSAVVVLAGDTTGGAKKASGPSPATKMTKAEVVQPADIPAAVKEAAEKAVDGIALTGATVTKKGDKSVYEITGKANDKEYLVTVDSDGKVLKSTEKKGEHKDKKKKDNE